MIPVCPKCDTALFILNFKEVEVDYCDNCRGVWLDAGELEHIAGGPLPGFQQQRGPVPPGKAQLCPRCDAPMEAIAAPGQLTLDRCPHGHGLWFDADELRELLAATQGDAATAVLNEIFGTAVKT